MTIHRWTTRRLLIALLAVASLCGVQAQPVAKDDTSIEAQQTPQFDPASPLTVDDAVAYALHNNPAITLGQQNVQIAKSQVGVAKANRLPTVNMTVNSTYMPAPVVNGNTIDSAAGTSGQATLAVPVWPTTRWKAPIRSAEANVGLNQKGLQLTRQQIVFQTRQAFYQLLAAQELLQTAQYSVKVAQTQLNLANATFAAGTAPRLDVEQARATLADAEVSLVRAQNAVSNSTANLATELGIPAGTDIAIVGPQELPVAPDSVDPLIAKALHSRPELLQLNDRREQQRANIDIIKLEQKPLINLQAGYADTIMGASGGGIEGLSAGAGLSINLYNGGKTKSEVAAARTQLAEIDTNQRQLELNVTLEVQQAWLDLQNALKQLVSAQQQQVAADEALRISEVRYENGEGILLEVEQARLRSTQARTTLATARYQAQTAAARLELAIGAPVP